MNIAITVWGNRVSPVFDAAQTLLLVEWENNLIKASRREFIAGTILASLIERLRADLIETLICGAISERPAAMIEQAGIRLVPFVAGRIEDVLQAYATGAPIDGFMMPGCRTVCCLRNRAPGRRRKMKRTGTARQAGSSKQTTEVTKCQDLTETKQ